MSVFRFPQAVKPERMGGFALKSVRGFAGVNIPGMLPPMKNDFKIGGSFANTLFAKQPKVHWGFTTGRGWKGAQGRSSIAGLIDSLKTGPRLPKGR